MVAKPGGDKIGRRRLDTHFLGIQKLGAKFDYDIRRGVYDIHAGRLCGTYMLLDEASVTGTANIIMASVLAMGTTTIYNAACEPYIQQLCHLLNRMGANISGIASNLLTIVGVDSLHGAAHTVLPDMIEVGSFIGMAAMVGDGISIKNVSYDNLGIIPYTFSRLGVQVLRHGDDLFIPRHDHYEIDSFLDGSFMTLSDAPWPGLTPDLLSVLLVVATQAKGTVLIHQKMFESRLFFVDKLIDMGAQIILCDPHRAVVVGHDHQIRLRGGRMTSPDIRAGIALLIAAMSADGTSRISNIEQIDRGYQNIEGRLGSLHQTCRRMIREDEVYKIGMLTKTHGVSGELNMAFTDDVFDRVEAEYVVCRMDGILVPFFMEEYRFRSDTTVLMKFEGVDTEEQARRMVGVEVYFPKALTEEAHEGEYTWSYFTGFTVVDTVHGELGQVEAVDESTLNVLFEVATPSGGKILLPAGEDLVDDIDHKNRKIYMTLPDGLLALGE